MQIKHGMLPAYSYRLSSPVHNVLFEAASQKSVVLYGQTCALYTKRKRGGKFKLRESSKEAERGEGGERGEMEDSGGEVLKLLHASDHHQYVGVCRGSLKVCLGRSTRWIYTHHNSLISSSVAQHTV